MMMNLKKIKCILPFKNFKTINLFSKREIFLGQNSRVWPRQIPEIWGDCQRKNGSWSKHSVVVQPK